MRQKLERQDVTVLFPILYQTLPGKKITSIVGWRGIYAGVAK